MAALVLRRSRRLLLGALAAAAWPVPARPSPQQPGPHAWLPGAKLQGSGRLSLLGQTVYEARLWVTEGFDVETFASRPLALELSYGLSLSGTRLAARSLQEMQRLGDPTPAQRSRWLAAMEQIFPDVASGDRLVGVLNPGAGVRFVHNGRPRGDIADATFATLFFAIWLSPRTSEPALRARLLGQDA